MSLPEFPAGPPAPQRGTMTEEQFAAAADAFAAWWEGLPAELQAWGAALIAGVNAANFTSASTTSREIGLGSKTFVAENGKLFVPGQFVVIVSAADPATDWMHGIVTSYDFATGWMVVDVAETGPDAAGTHVDWIIGLSGPKGATGDPADAGVDVQEFTLSGEWTKPANARLVLIEAWGAGGGGAGGSMKISNVDTRGGGGGGGGGYVQRLYRAADLSATEDVTIGAGGTGGASRNTDGNGNAGSAGGATSVGSSPLRVWAGGGAGGPATTANIGARGGGVIYDPSVVGRPLYAPGSGEAEGNFGTGYFVATTSDGHGASSAWGGGQGGAARGTAGTVLYGGDSAMGGAGGGAGGGAQDSGPGAQPGGNGGGNGLGQSGGSGGASGNPGTAGADATIPRTGGGGGGSTGSNSATAGDGGDGAAPGGGGGGGGAASVLSSGTSGAGGDGAPGMVRITTWFDA